MFRKTLVLFVAIIVLFSCAAAEGMGVSATDMMGREITLSAPATRIVALTAADCEILCAIGAEDTLVGRGEYCDYPASVLSVPSVESGYETNIEQIIALQPQLVLMNSMAQSKEGVEALERAGIAVAVSEANDIAGVYEAITMIGTFTGRNVEADALIAQMRHAFNALYRDCTGKTVYFEVSALQWGLWTAGSQTFLDELAAICGVQNAFADCTGWVEISEEQVLVRDPDYIVSVTGLEETDITTRNGWEGVRAVCDNRVLSADYNVLSRPGPRLMEAAELLWAFFQ